MDLDDVDRKLLRALLEDADRSQRDLARIAGVTAPTVASRRERLRDLGLVGRTTADVDLARLGTLVLVLAPPDELQAVQGHEDVFQVHRTQQNRVVALALVEGPDAVRELHAAFPRAETHVLTERTLSKPPRPAAHGARVPCSQCGKLIEGEPIGLTLGGRSYVACCPTCKRALEERYERHAT